MLAYFPSAGDDDLKGVLVLCFFFSPASNPAVRTKSKIVKMILAEKKAKEFGVISGFYGRFIYTLTCIWWIFFSNCHVWPKRRWM